MVDRFIKIENLGRAGPLARTYHFHLHTSHYFLLFLSRWTKNTPFWLWIFISHSEYGRGRDVTFTWLSDSLHKQQGTSRSKDSIMGWCMWWFDLCGLDLRSVTRTGPRSSSGSPTKILNLRSIHKGDVLFVRRERKEKILACMKMKKVSPGSMDQIVPGRVGNVTELRPVLILRLVLIFNAIQNLCSVLRHWETEIQGFSVLFYQKVGTEALTSAFPTLVLPEHVGFSFLLTEVIQFNPCTGFNQLMVHFENSEQVWVLVG